MLLEFDLYGPYYERVNRNDASTLTITNAADTVTR